MSYLRNLVLLAVLILTLNVVLTTLSSEQPQEEAARFLKILQSGDERQTVLQFGDNTCGCQPRGGYVAFIKYESGEPDNLAFAFGHPLKVGEMSQTPVPTRLKNPGGNLPWEKPESREVRIKVQFDPKLYSPYFLPLDMAFGHAVKEEDLKKFCADPAPNFTRELAIRLRPELTAGVVKPPDNSSDAEKFMADHYMPLLPPAERKYFRPLDAGVVTMADGSSVPASNFAAQLPRLREAEVKLLVVRRGRFKHWQVKKGTVFNPVFQLADGKLVPLSGPNDELVPGSAVH